MMPMIGMPLCFTTAFLLSFVFPYTAESVLQYWRMGLAILDVMRWSWVKIGVDMGVRRERIG